MIRATLTAKGHLLDDLSAYLSSFQESVNATLSEVAVGAQAELLNELAYTPSERDPSQPLDWTSDTQRRAYFASNAFGAGIPFQRTGALPTGWTVVIDGNGRLVIANNLPGALYLYGSLSKSNPGKWQQNYLRMIGWVPAYETVFVWAADIVEEVTKQIDGQFKGLGSATGSTRAYTRK